MSQRTVFLVVLLWSLPTLPACAMSLTYTAEPMQAWVVDADTKQPLEDVIVVARWELERGTVGGNVPAGQLKVMEAVTDKEGKFSFPGFGPETLWDSFLVNKDPELILFKSGYEFRRLLNPYTSDRELRTRPQRRSDWNGKRIALKSFKGTQEEYARHLGSLSLSWIYTGNECEWKKIPRMVFVGHEQAMTFKKQGIVTSLYMIDNLIPVEGYTDKCGAREYFKGYQP